MNVYSKPIVFLVLAIVVISVGTLVTTFIPLFAGSTYTKIDGIKPYNALELTGRDIYIREGCNNCHTQTVRPLKFETDRYGEYSRGGEFEYDRPHLWGSRRGGPDLAREGGKYPDSWQYSHFKDPRAITPGSSMPAYPWLADNNIDPAAAEKKMKALDFPYTPEEINELSGKTEMDALVAYMQKLGKDFKAIQAAKEPKPAATNTAALTNPHANDAAASKEGHELYEANCASCHGEHQEGGIGQSLASLGTRADGDIFVKISEGTQAGMPPFESGLGDDKIWKVVTFLKTGGKPTDAADHGHH